MGEAIVFTSGKGGVGKTLSLIHIFLERRGIGPVKATQLKAIAELSKRIARTGRGYHLSMNCPSSIADYYMRCV